MKYVPHSGKVGGEDWQIYAFQAFGEKSLANT